MRKVLIVEDDEAMAVALQDGFAYEGFEVTLARDGEKGLELGRSSSPDLIILDVMMPKKSGLDVCKEIRAGGNTVPIIMLTARGQEIDKVLGLKLGADDYVTKPFSFMELMARVEAILRRSSGAGGELDSYSFGDIDVNFRTFDITKKGESLELSQREFMLLKYLIERRGEVVAREELLEGVWGYKNIPYTRTVDVHVAKLRKKIEGSGDPRYIVTVHRVGYKFTG